MNDHTTHDSTQEIPYGYCQCGCGQKTSIAKQTDNKRGHVKGEPMRFISGHHPPSKKKDRFWQYVNLGNPSDCWEWQGCISTTGYGKFRLNGRHMLAHRVSWELHNGPIPAGMHICHSCDNPACVNPHHLWLGTPADNMHDRDEKGRHIAPHTRGEAHGRAKITEAQVMMMRKLWKQGVSQSEIGRRFGISSHQAHMIVRHKHWRHVP